MAKYDGPGKLGSALRTLWGRGSGKLTALAILLLLFFLAISAIATRAEAGNPFGQTDELIVLANYLAITLVIVALGINFTENANGLHRLYRDRLSVAFRLGHPTNGTSLKLHELGDFGPYLLVNGTLNVRRPLETTANAEAPRTECARDKTAVANRAVEEESGDYIAAAAEVATKGQGLWKKTQGSLDAATGTVRNWMYAAPSRQQKEPSKRVVQLPLPERPRPDPAKRGRNAEFFVFSKHFVGSDSTGYVSSDLFAKEEPQLDLAAAVAISGAAVSSSMGRVSIGWLGPTLALLNLRLGFWLRNPKHVILAAKQLDEAKPSADSTDQSAKFSWEDILRLYLFAEAFGRLRSDSSRIYITDGGHIDNIGLYQLLKRRCKFIVVIDAEADPGMNFGAFADVQRFARIDEGVLISLDWWPVRTAALARSADRSKPVSRDSEAHNQHFAVGRIIYEDGQEGILVYVKATVTGDEPDYVLDYERRYPNFPHEATSDQFFSEEQMEAYRALGFHAMRVALDKSEIAADAKKQTVDEPVPARKGVPTAKKNSMAAQS
ncbi:hypothetical protein [Allomesorhizobium alhagi]|uniref:hypothetical protein n=1 Tax=Allomesorhizobium alhagi TaxID=475067 RepID=UPI00111236B9|nr:hypothetical protein [Mesorhizobium alhagi]